MEYQILIIVCLIAIVVFLSKHSWFKNTKEKIEKPIRRYIKDVEPGEVIQIEWHRAKHKICDLRCLNNDPTTKKILLVVRWGGYKKDTNEEYEKVVFDYNDPELSNFHLLNTYKKEENNKYDDDYSDGDYDIATLQKKMNECLAKEEYEKADKLQKKIDKLLKK